MPSVVSNAAWPGRTPKYPSMPGTTTSSTCSVMTARDGVATSSVSRSAIVLLAQLLGLVDGLADVADHVEGLLGQVVVLAIDDLAERLDRVRDLHVSPRRAGELLGHEKWLREEALDLARARHRDL